MKIAKALKIKNRLAGEVSRLRGIVQAHNSVEEGQEQQYDVLKIINEDLLHKIRDLVTVKTVIACANAHSFVKAPTLIESRMTLMDTPYWAIFQIAELKGLIETLNSTCTKNGSYNERRGLSLSADSKATVYVAALKQQDVDAKIARFQTEIDKLQDKLDAHNATSDSPLIDGIEI